MKLKELFESSKKYGQQYTEAEKQQLEKPSPKNIESAFIVGKTIFDNEYGLGQTPDNSNIIYMGFAMEMNPRDFLGIVSPGDREDDAESIKNKMLDNIPYGSPLLSMQSNFEEWEGGAPLKLKISNHEGRARSLAFSKLNPGLKLPVHVTVRGGMRARDFNEKFFEDLRKMGFIHQDKSLDSRPVKLDIGKIFWNHTTL
jgi:hypothetical protein